MIKILGKRVLIEEIAIKKESKVILLNKEKQNDQYSITRKVIGVGEDVTDIRVGDTPYISIHSKPHYFEVVESSDNKIITNLVYYNTDIVGIDNE